MEGFMIRTGFYDKCALVPSASSPCGMLPSQQLTSEGLNNRCGLGLILMSPKECRAG